MRIRRIMAMAMTPAYQGPPMDWLSFVIALLSLLAFIPAFVAFVVAVIAIIPFAPALVAAVLALLSFLPYFPFISAVIMALLSLLPFLPLFISFLVGVLSLIPFICLEFHSRRLRQIIRCIARAILNGTRGGWPRGRSPPGSPGHGHH